ncbi:MAG: hypothetical protein HC836_39350 [Richelia sp. RM2_1_2]|nr:hypothetical protein [Richelia sp. RM2_1_2]
MKNTYIFLILILTTVFACTEDEVKPVIPSSDVNKISELLVGEWNVNEFDYLPIDAPNLAIQTFKSNDANLCNKIADMFKSDKVVSKYIIQYNNYELKVQKHYFCDSKIDEVTWLVELNLDDTNPNLNWMTQKNFLIIEKQMEI